MDLCCNASVDLLHSNKIPTVSNTLSIALISLDCRHIGLRYYVLMPPCLMGPLEVACDKQYPS